MRTVVVTDSSGRPSPAAPLVVAEAVVGVPITFLLAARQVPDDRIDPRLVDEALARSEPVKTRAPGVIDYLDAVDGTDAQAAVILTPAAELTAMWRHACHTPWLADRPVAVVDVVPVGRERASRARVLGRVGTAEPLVAAGMVDLGRGQGRGRPTIFEARQGMIEPLRVLDGEDPVTALADLYAREQRAGSPVTFTGAGGGRGVQAMAERLAALGDSGRPARGCSPAMTVYTGRGVVGIAWLGRA